MKYSEYKKNLEQNPEYQEANAELELVFAFGDAVLHARLEKGWTQTELAREWEQNRPIFHGLKRVWQIRRWN